MRNVRWIAFFLSAFLLSGCGKMMDDFLGSIGAETPEDVSFSISQPTAGALFKGGSSTSIAWTLPDELRGATDVTIEYSKDGGATWSTTAAAVSNSGAFTWTLPADDSTECKIRVKAIVAEGLTAIAESDLFGIDSTPPTLGANQIGADQIVVAEDGSVSFNVNAANDANPGVTYEIVSPVSAGTLSSCLANTSSVNCTYVPAANDNGTVSFTYRATDAVGNVATGTAQVDIEITPVNDAPALVFAPCATSVNQNAAYACTPPMSDVDTGDTHTYSFAGAHTCSAWMSVNAGTGEISGTPGGADVGNCVIALRVNDGTVNTTITQNFTVNDTVNDAPVITATCPTSVNEDSAYSCSTAPAVADPDAGDTHTWSFDATNDCAWATINAATGAIGGTPNNGHVGSCTLAFKTTDNGTGNLVSNIISVGVTVNNTAPTLTIADAANLAEDSAATVIRDNAAVQASDEGQGTTTYSFDHATTSGTKCDDNKISLTVDAGTGAVTYQPAADYTGTCNIKVSFSDGNGGTVSDEFAITVTNANDAPVITATCPTSVNEDSAYSCSVAPAVTDADAGDTHTWSFDATNDCSWATINPGTGAIGGTPDNGDVGTCTLAFLTTDDGVGTLDSNVISVSVTVNNTAPTMTIADAANINEDSPATEIRDDAAVQASDEGQGTTTYSFDHATTSGTKCDDNKVSLSIDANTGAVTFQPAANYTGTCNIKVSFDDGNGGSVSDEFSITVSDANDAPVITATCPASINEDSAYSCSVAPAVTDADAGDTHTWSFDATNDCSWATINPGTGAIGGTPDNGDVGTCTLAFLATDDGVGTLDSNVISVSVTVNNTAPTLTIADAANIAEDAGATVIRADGDVQASDEGQGTTTYSLDNAGTSGTKCDDNKVSLTINSSTGAVTYQPAANYTGTCNIKVSFSDGNGGTVSDEFSITVTSDNDAPVITATCPASVNEDSAYSCSAGPSVTDADAGDTHTWSFDATNDCAWATINPGTGAIGGAPDNGDVGTCTLAFLTTDDGVGTLDSNIISVSVTVNNTAPTLTIADAANIAEDAGATVIRDDVAVQASDEGQGTTTYSFDHAGTSGTKCDDNKVSLSIDANTGAVTYQPAANYTGTCNIKVSFADGNGGTVSDEFAITVTGSNDAPVITATCPTSLNEDVAYTCSAGPSVTDPDTGDTQTWSFTAGHDCLWANINPGTGAITGTPIDDEVGSCTLEFKSNDGTVDSNTISIGVTVNNVQPTLTIADTSMEEDEGLTIVRTDAQVQASDETYGTYSLIAASGTKCSDNGTVNIDSINGEVEFTPAADFAGTCNINVQFDDGNASNNLVSDEFQVTVDPVNDIPVITSWPPDQEIFAGNSVTGLAAVANPGGGAAEAAQTLSWDTCTSSNPLITVTCNAFTGGNATIDIDTTAGQAVASIITLKVIDSAGGVSLAKTFNVNTTTGTPLYEVAGSLRFNDDDSAYLSRTFAAAGTGGGRTATFSFWAKRANLGTEQFLINWPASSADGLRFLSNDSLYGYVGNTGWAFETVGKFRDPSTWLHIVLTIDSTQSTPANRVRLWVNGVPQVFSTSTYTSMTQNVDVNVMDNVLHVFGKQHSGTSYYDGYLSDFYAIDGQALLPTAFAEETDKGEWLPKAYTGTYGTNGFHLDFSDPTNTTTLGADTSGNANNWTLNNLAITDHVIDTPTNNFATINPVASYMPKLTLFDGNLVASGASAGGAPRSSAISSQFVSSGKWYWEVKYDSWSGGGQQISVGVVNDNFRPGVASDFLNTGTRLWEYYSFGSKYDTGSSSAYGDSFTNGDTVSIALDMDSGKIWWAKNGVWQASGNPATGANPAFTGLLGHTVGPFSQGSGSGSNQWTSNFGQGGQVGFTFDASAGGYFKYAPPAGFKALSTKNLPDPVIAKPNEYFDALTYTGDGNAASRSITGLNFQPDFVWKKSRSQAQHHWLHDAVRGADKGSNTNRTDAEYTSTRLTSFSSDGFSFATNDIDTNGLNETYVAWAWKEGVTPGFDIATYSGTGVERTVAHGLGATPKMIIIKRRDAASNWVVGHQHINSASWNNYHVKLNTTAGIDGSLFTWNNDGTGGSDPTSTDFTIGTDAGVNANGGSFVAYLWSEVAGFSKFGGYTGNGSADGPFVYTGFRPRWIMLKETGAADNWEILDLTRSPSNPTNKLLYANGTDSEYTLTAGNERVDLLSNGFKFRTSNGGVNASGGTYIYAAFAESPFKKGLNRPKVEFSLASSSAGENAGTANIQLVLDKAAASDVVVNYTVSGTAAQPADHNLVSGSTTISAGQTSKNIAVNIVDDINYENPDETIIVTLTSATVANLGTLTQHTLTITNNDDLPPEFVGIDIVSGPPAGGTVIKIGGDNFQPGATVDIGGDTCTVTNVTATEITCTTPAGTPGYADIVITNPDGQIITVDDGFLYDEPFLEIANSLRFNNSDSARLTRSFSSGNQKTWTFSAWVKRGKLGSTARELFRSRNSPYPITTIEFSSYSVPDSFGIWAYTGSGFKAQKFSTAVFRDPAKWYHFVVAVDTTQATASNRIRLYADGKEITSFAENTNPAQNDDLDIGAATIHCLAGCGAELDGYMSDVFFIDGQQLTPSAFGGFDAAGIWRPKNYGGTYGTNGFHLDFSNSSDLGNDISSNNNDWTPANLDATDRMIDTPTNNFATLSPHHYNTLGNGVSDASLKMTGITTATVPYSRVSPSTIRVSSKKWYVEYLIGINGNAHMLGIASAFDTDGLQSTSYMHNFYDADYRVDASSSAYGVQAQAGDTIGMAFDLDLGTIEWFRNGTSLGQKTGINTAREYAVAVNVAFTNAPPAQTGHINFGQGGQSGLTYYPAAEGYFKYPPPAGFKALSTKNMPDPAVQKPSDYFDAITYAGSASNQSINTLAFSPNLAWFKSRNTTDGHYLYDAVRGLNKALLTNSTAAEDSVTRINSFDSNGYTLLGGFGATNAAGQNFVSWNWRESALSGFDIVSYTGNGTSRSLAHALDSAPKMIIVKDRTGANDWAVYHASNTAAPETDYLLMNSTAATADDDTYWNDTSPGYTKLLVHGDGMDGSTNFVDSSTRSQSFTFTGEAQIDTAQSKFGGSSLLFDGSGDKIVLANPAGIALAGNFTIDAWVRLGTTSGERMIYANGTNKVLGLDGTALYFDKNNAWGCNLNGGGTWSTNTWYHVAAVRANGTLTLYQNGTALASRACSNTVVGTGNDTIGSRDSADYFNGHIDEFRILVGKAAWTANFTPPTSAYALDSSENVFHLGTNADVNANGNQYVAYLFAEKKGFSKFGSYTGNGSADGPLVYTGFKPRWFLYRRTNTSGSWQMVDTTRNPWNVVSGFLEAESGLAEWTNASYLVDALANGIKIRGNGANINSSGASYIYAAFAEHPFNPGLNRPKVTLASSSNTVNEDAGTVNLAVKLDREADSDVIVHYTVSGTASSPSDHNLTSGTIMIPAGSVSQNLAIAIVDDPNDEPNETVIVTLNGSTQANLGSITVHTLTITDDDLEAPAFTGIDVDSGDIGGGTVIVIDGTGFQPGATVTIGGVTCTVTNVTATQITCTTNAGTIGWNDIVITNPDTQTVVVDDGFFYGKLIANSLRFNDDDSAQLTRAMSAAATSSQLATLSAWVKRGNLGTSQYIAGTASPGTTFDLNFNSSNFLSSNMAFSSGNISFVTNAVFRDPGAWMHIVLVIDTTQATASDRIKLHVNGVQQTFSSATYPNQNATLLYWFVNGITLRLGAAGSSPAGSFFDGYISEFYGIDGQALAPTEFGAFDARGVWQPKNYTGTYGTNGFHLDFSNSGSLGADSSGNGNNWTVNNLDATDQVIDTPTNGFSTLNSVDKIAGTISQGNLQITPTGSGGARGTTWINPSDQTGYYFEAASTNLADAMCVGFGSADKFLTSTNYGTVTDIDGAWVHRRGAGDSFRWNYNFGAAGSGATDQGQGVLPVAAVNDVIGFAIKAGKVWISINNSWVNGGDPAAGTGHVVALTKDVAPITGCQSGTWLLNFGQGGQSGLTYSSAAGGRFKYAPPTGFKALSTRNLPKPEVHTPTNYFNAVTYAGQGTNLSISSLAFSPDLVWIKKRDVETDNHNLVDKVRGASANLATNSTAVETTASRIASFDANGFTLTGNTGVTCDAGRNYVAWNWKESPEAGFDIVSYTGTGTARTVPHSLGTAPKVIIVKKLNVSADDFTVYHASLGPTKVIYLSRTDAEATSSTFWNDTAPTATAFTVGTNGGVNASGANYIAYVFSDKEGLSKFGKYTGNGAADGPFIHTDFKPRFFMVKRTDAANDWIIHDTARNPLNAAATLLLAANTNGMDMTGDSGALLLDFLSNGMKIRNGTQNYMNASGGTYIYMTFGETPAKYSRAK